MKTWTLNDYLLALKRQVIVTNRPFDTNSEDTVLLGELAANLYIPLPPLEEFIPPTEQSIARVYKYLDPVLEEITRLEEFEWNLQGRTVAKAYLFNAINKMYKGNNKSIVYTPEQMAFQDFLRLAADSLVDGHSPEKALRHFTAKEEKFISSILSYITLDRPDKEGLMQYYKDDKKYVQAFKLSLVDAQNIEQEIAASLQTTLSEVISIVQKDKETSKNKSKFQGTMKRMSMGLFSAPKEAKLPEIDLGQSSHDTATLLRHFHSVLEFLTSAKSPELTAAVLIGMKNNPFFSAVLPGKDSDLKLKPDTHAQVLKNKIPDALMKLGQDNQKFHQLKTAWRFSKSGKDSDTPSINQERPRL